MATNNNEIVSRSVKGQIKFNWAALKQASRENEIKSLNAESSSLKICEFVEMDGASSSMCEDLHNQTGEINSAGRRDEVKAVCLVGQTCENEQLKSVLQATYAHIAVYECPNSDGLEHKKVSGIVHIVAEFENSSEFKYLNGAECTILGPTVVLEHAECGLLQLYHLKCFHALRLSFRGFDEAEVTDVTKHTLENGGKVVPEGPETTHLVIFNSANMKGPIYKPNDACKVVDVEWFWVSIQRDHCVTESLYAVPDGKQLQPPTSDKKPSYPLSECTNAPSAEKSLSKLSQSSAASGTGPRRSRVSGDLLGRKSTDSVLERSSDMSGVVPDHLFSTDDAEALSSSPCKLSGAEPKFTKRYQVCSELLQTERNYVQVLNTIVKLFKEPLEELQETHAPCVTPLSASATIPRQQNLASDDPNSGVFSASDRDPILTPGAKSLHGAAFNFVTPSGTLAATPSMHRELLSKQETQLIFGKIPAILDVHNNILVQLEALMKNWSETNQVGSIWFRAAAELEKCYPHFVNNFDKAKETLCQCDRSRSKFHAFLKGRQSRSECQRQSLQELLIRPVQRLPSVTLLLNDILKATDKFNPDHEQLVRALDAIKNALKTVNDNKRTTEQRIRIFEIFQDIENFPEQLISAQRTFLASLDAIDLDGQVSGRKGRHITFFLFNDFVELAKRRTKALKTVAASNQNSATGNSGPNSNSQMQNVELGEFRPAAAKQHGKMHKHIVDFRLTSVRRIGDVQMFCDTEQLFTLTIRTELSEDDHVFLAETSDTREKKHFLRMVANQITSTAGREEQPLKDIDFDCDTATTVAKQLKHTLTTRAGRLSRALSLSKVSSGQLRRTVSSMAVGFGGTLARMSHSRLPMASNVFDERDENTPPPQINSAAAQLQIDAKNKTLASGNRRLSLSGVKANNCVNTSNMGPPVTPHRDGKMGFGRRLSFMGTLRRASSRLAMTSQVNLNQSTASENSGTVPEIGKANENSGCVLVGTGADTARLQSCDEADI